MNVFNFFQTPIYYEQLTLDNDSIVQHCYSLKEKDKFGRSISNRGGWQSNDLQGVHEPLNTLFDSINEHSNKFKNILGVKENYVVTLDNIWINISSTNDINSLHTHPGSFLSGVYYAQTPKDCGNLTFYNKNAVEYHWMKTYFTEAETHTALAKTINVKSTVGKLYLFPGWAEHEVEPNRSAEDRISISFNTSIKLHK